MAKRRLSTPQLNIYNTHKTFPDTAINNIGGASFISCNEFNPEYWAKAINMYLKNNIATRMRIEEEGLEPLQYFAEHSDDVFEVFDLSSLTEEEEKEKYEKWIREPFNPNKNQISFKILKLNNNKSGFFIVANHAISDAYTIGTMVEQINRSYTNLLLNANYEEETKPSYEIFLEREAEYLDSESYKKDHSFWVEEFTEIPKITSISTRTNANNFVDGERYSIKIDKGLTKEIYDFCSQNNVSIAVLFEAIVFAYMNRITGENDIIIGSPVLNRISKNERQAAGMFISTVPFKISFNDGMNFSELFGIVSKKKKSLFKHQKFPFMDIQEDIRERFGYTGKLFDVVVSYQNAKITQNNDGIIGETHWIHNGTSLNELIVHIDDRDNNNELSLNLDYQVESFDKEEIVDLTNRLLQIIGQVIGNKDIKVSDVDILTEKDKSLYKIFNSNELSSTGKTVHELFEEQAELNPDKIALIFEDKVFTYKQLNAMANSLAHTIREYSLSKDEIIPIIGERDFNVIISMLAIAKAGYAYFVVDYNEYPEGRVDTLLDDFKPKLLVKNRCNYIYIGASEIDLEMTNSWSENYSNPDNVNSADDRLCLIHTSGSTGMPKTVIYSHDGVSNLGKNLSYLCENEDYCISIITMSFDAFQMDTYLPLLNGKTMVLSSSNELKSISGTEKLISKYPNSFTITVPSRLEQFLSSAQTNAWKNINSMVLGGELITPQLLEEIHTKLSVNLYNLYGPTETTVCNSGKKIINSNTNIGTPLPGFNVYIVDRNNMILPIGTIGEIAVAGLGVALGYLNRPELTAEKFVKLNSYNNLKIYKTGDYGIINNNGELEFKGRRDEQVKFNGIRIEIQEIENLIANFRGILKCAVVKKTNNNRDYLCAYYVANISINEESLTKFLEDKLPLYMIPQFFHKIPTMPYSQSGKLNKNLLPDLDYNRLNQQAYLEPQTDIQKAICSIWAEVLGQHKIGISNTFSSLGGTSKDMIKMLLLLEKRLSLIVETKDIPKNPTVSMLEEIIEGKKISNEINENWDLSNINVNLNKNLTNSILLIGSTGYFGSHLLYELLNTTNREIYCLVRDENKFNSIISYYFGNSLDIFIHRIHLISGDITKEKLGLSTPEYEKLDGTITQIFNSASNVKHYGAVEDFNEVNVTGVYNLLKLCASSGAEMHHISTLSVSGHGLIKTAPIARAFTEDDLDVGQNYRDNPYVWTKFLAEKLIIEFRKIGVNANVYRVGSLDKRSYDEKFQINEDESGFQLIIDSIKKIGAMPKIISEMPTYIIPVDKCAEMVVNISNGILLNNTFHIFNSEMRMFEEYLQTLNLNFEEVDLLPFMAMIDQLAEKDSRFIIVSQYLKDYMSHFKKQQITNEKTLSLLESIGERQGKPSKEKVYKV